MKQYQTIKHTKRRFIEKFSKLVKDGITGFDRIIFKDYILPLNEEIFFSDFVIAFKLINGAVVTDLTFFDNISAIAQPQGDLQALLRQ